MVVGFCSAFFFLLKGLKRLNKGSVKKGTLGASGKTYVHSPFLQYLLWVFHRKANLSKELTLQGL